jgi:hypothetical protein
MSNSSAPVDYSTTLDNSVGIIAQDLGISLPGAITTIGNSYYYTTGTSMSSSSTVTIGGINSAKMTISSNGNVGIGSMSSAEYTWKIPQEFVDAFPAYDRIEKMCKEYPGLAIAFEKFKTVYNLVKDDYDTPEDQRPKP